ncbi:hypothetical protein ACFY8S_01250 [Streptomyces hygroscopicus]|uniref:hypothetical protein n=1 Tax=Streptomyces hygroscopicus TaxID=1912 RepID=UPI00369CB567
MARATLRWNTISAARPCGSATRGARGSGRSNSRVLGLQTSLTGERTPDAETQETRKAQKAKAKDGLGKAEEVLLPLLEELAEKKPEDLTVILGDDLTRHVKVIGKLYSQVQLVRNLLSKAQGIQRAMEADFNRKALEVQKEADEAKAKAAEEPKGKAASTEKKTDAQPAAKKATAKPAAPRSKARPAATTTPGRWPRRRRPRSSRWPRSRRRHRRSEEVRGAAVAAPPSPHDEGRGRSYPATPSVCAPPCVGAGQSSRVRRALWTRRHAGPYGPERVAPEPRAVGVGVRRPNR